MIFVVEYKKFCFLSLISYKNITGQYTWVTGTYLYILISICMTCICCKCMYLYICIIYLIKWIHYDSNENVELEKHFIN